MTDYPLDTSFDRLLRLRRLDPGAYPRLNLPLLRKTLETVQEKARVGRGWSQALWHSTRGCHTTACFAGWACELSGGVWARNDGFGTFVELPSGERTPTNVWATELLGLTGREADLLFGSMESELIPRVERFIALGEELERREEDDRAPALHG